MAEFDAVAAVHAASCGDEFVRPSIFFDALEMEFHTVKLRRNKDCPLCGDNPTVTALIDYDAFCGMPTVPA